MDDDEFLTIVQQRLGIGREQAERATRATVETLAQRIAAGEARDLAAELPPELAPWLNAPSEAERFDVDEFLRRVAEREDIDVETAERHARAFFAALSRAISPKELSDMVAELPKDFAPLLPSGPHIEFLSADAFVQRAAGSSISSKPSPSFQTVTTSAGRSASSAPDLRTACSAAADLSYPMTTSPEPGIS
jgi:uncharacterized protein (DUF2267 family)